MAVNNGQQRGRGIDVTAPYPHPHPGPMVPLQLLLQLVASCFTFGVSLALGTSMVPTSRDFQGSPACCSTSSHLWFCQSISPLRNPQFLKGGRGGRGKRPKRHRSLEWRRPLDLSTEVLALVRHSRLSPRLPSFA